MNFQYTYIATNADGNVKRIDHLPNHFEADTAYTICRETSALHNDNEYYFSFAIVLSPLDLQLDDVIIGYTNATIVCAMDLPHDAVALSQPDPIKIPVSVDDTPDIVVSLFDTIHNDLFAEFMERTLLEQDIRKELFTPQSLN